MPWQSLSNLVLAPVHLVRVASSARSFADNPILGSDRLNRWGLHEQRVALAQRLAARRRARIAPALAAEDVEAFKRNGILVRRQALPPAVFARLRDSMERLRAPGRETVQGGTISRLIPITSSVLAPLGEEARAVLADPPWMPLLYYAASARITPVQFIQTILSQAGPGEGDPQLDLHSDTFCPSVKAWLYMHDVAIEDGPFVYVPGSHRATPERLAWERERSLAWRDDPNAHSRRGSFRISQGKLARLGLGVPVAYAVPANTLVVADTFGFHARGASSCPSVRVSLWAQGRRNPFLPWAGQPVPRPDWLREREAPLF